MNHYRHDRTQIQDLTTTTTPTTTTLPPQQQYPLSSSPPTTTTTTMEDAEPAIEAVRVVEWFPFPQTIMDDDDEDKIRQQRWKCLAIFCVSTLTIALGVNLYLLFT